MRAVIIGAGPAGLYLAYLLKRARPNADIAVYEQNPPDATFGFGLAFSDPALEFLRAEDQGTWAAMEAALERWRDSVLCLNGTEIRIDGMGYAGIARLRLLQILRERARSVGIRLMYGCPIPSVAEIGEADLIVGADGINSVVRRSAPFETRIEEFSNHFAWFGTPKRFRALTHTFIRTPAGCFNAHHHPHASDMSTFVVEMDVLTFHLGGFAGMGEEQSRIACETLFKDTLEGAPLISNKSIWRQFPQVTNRRWFCGNRVLLGDALHSAHFSIGSGTRLAMEDAIALSRALQENNFAIPASLAAYEQARRPEVEKLVSAANASAAWYEQFDHHMRLPPLEFAMSYITRSGRVDEERLKRTSPEFMAAYEAYKRVG